MADTREFAFLPGVKKLAIERQGGICAGCTRSIRFRGAAHHVIPEQTGKYNRAQAAFLRTLDNCVVICRDCHYRFHEGGKYADGAVAEPEYFPNSHGPKGAAEHRSWCRVIHAQWRRIFPGVA